MHFVRLCTIGDSEDDRAFMWTSWETICLLYRILTGKIGDNPIQKQLGRRTLPSWPENLLVDIGVTMSPWSNLVDKG